ncbi:RagB/SusD family nutrient uptake outer membrane protein [Saccharicrinis sp. GN24d3]|uniref:RagB/SusD family nutrient uptake outer membrane protein n=1 Tax=Saccharicrinis sp. GN24d3 TaxID=3458416 RepID=UPI004035441A
MKNIFLIIAAVFLFASCEDYLARQEDEALTFEKIWLKRETTEQYLYNVYGFMPNEADVGDDNIWIPASDEASFTYNRSYRKMNDGTWNPSSPPGDKWDVCYQGIREANTFMGNVHACPDLSSDEKDQYFAEARFLRSYYYFMLVRMYGPVILIGDEPVDFNAASLDVPRNTLKECINYIVAEMDACAQVLPTSRPNNWLGKPTKGTALAVKARLSLYAARPLFNGNEMYAGVANQDGTKLFPASYDKEKWKAAADANKAVIDLGVYQLHKSEDNDPYKNYMETFHANWNEEIIFGYSTPAWRWTVVTIPRVVGGVAYGGVAPTQQMVDAYAMKNGKYPITAYNTDGSPVIDAAAGYSEEGFVNFEHPIDQPEGTVRRKSTFRMYVDREPRFYASVFWSGADWIYMGRPNDIKVPDFSTNGNSGPGQSHDYPKPGYMWRKMTDPSLDTKNNQWGTLSWPLIRLAEIYLNYVEALNEYDPTHADILTYMNLVRERAGVPNIEQVYPEAVGDQVKMRKLIRKERQIELSFEAHRYFDTRTWMIAEQTDDGPMYGMNVKAHSSGGSTPASFWQREVFETRVFKPKHYLYPIKQREMDRNKQLVQNYGW